MVTIAVAFDGNPLIIVTFHDEVDPEVADPHLRIDPEAALTKQVEHLTFEIRLTPIAAVL